jgi:spore coat protein U-like protein
MKKILLAGAACAALAATPAMAGPITGSPFTVSVTVQTGCVISADVGNITFVTNGGPPTGSNVPQPMFANPQVQCTNNTPYSVSFNSTKPMNGTTRTMVAPSPAGSINYQILGCANSGMGGCTPTTPIGSNNSNVLAVPVNSGFSLLFQISNDSSWTSATTNVTYSDTVTMQVNF